ncbi:MAG TPA: efflux RND transporter permease subunit [Gemmataceae bacterium]|jgi:multidrug efflux pump|nr:efflux RND transporter permease subunit [Gemmataceae bacterium]
MISHFFIDRPIFATVLSIVIVIVGVVAYTQLPVAQYPEVTPPTVQVTATYPGANAKTVADTVATPIEQEVNGVERMLYMSSKCTNDGQMNLDVTFELGTDLDTAQVLVQNRVSIAQAKLPEEVKRIGVTTKKKSPSILLCVNLVSGKKPDGGYYYDQLYLSNFATLSVKDDLARIKGVGDVSFLGPRDYSMRVWLDPDKLASKDLTAVDVINAVKEQNRQVAAGRLGQSPVPTASPVQFQLPINTKGRLTSVEQFENIVLKTSDKGGVVHFKDIVRDSLSDKEGVETEKGVELGAKNYDVNSYLDGEPSTTLAVFQLPGSNALDTAHAIRQKMEELKGRFPEGVDYHIYYDTTVFVKESIASVMHTLFEAFVLVFIVVLVFLQNWRATIIPMVAVPVSLVGTFGVMAVLSFSLNNLSLFGLVLAIGIVVDDAIVVVENVERWLAEGLSPHDASRKAMDEVTGPVIAIALVLCAVFVPTAFMAGISGQFYKQFALTIAASTVISAFNSLTLSPALAALLLKPHGHGEHGHTQQEALPRLGIALIGGLVAYYFLLAPAGRLVGIEVGGHGTEHVSEPPDQATLWGLRAAVFVAGLIVGWLVAGLVNRLLGAFFKGFNWAFDVTINGYARMVSGLIRVSVIALLVYGGLMGLTFLGFKAVPTGFIPDQDKGYLVVNIQLPDGASLDRTDKMVREAAALAREDEGVAHTIDLPGYSPVLSTNISNIGGMFIILKPFEERAGIAELSAPAVIARLRQKFAAFTQGRVGVFGAPPVDGLGTTGGFKLQVQDRRGGGLRALMGSVQNLADQGNRDPRLLGLFSSFSVTQPQLFVDVDEEKAKAQKIQLQDIDATLQAYLGSVYVNDFFFQNRNWQVNLQAAPKYRMEIEDIGNLEVRNGKGDRVPLRSLIKVRYDSGPAVVNHYNLYPSAEINGSTAPGVSSGQAITIMDRLGNTELPSTMGYEWTELTYQQILASKDILTKLAFPLAVVFVLLVLSAQYESWSLPLSIILIVPMCLLAAITGVWLARMDNNIFTQIGLVVLIGLAAKNAILIVEFAKQLQDGGKGRVEATVEACRLRLRPILMTSFAFILGVVPLVLAKGAGAEMRKTLGIAVFSGMLGVTIFGVFFTPVFYVVVRWFTEKKSAPKEPSLVESHEEVPVGPA